MVNTNCTFSFFLAQHISKFLLDFRAAAELAHIKLSSDISRREDNAGKSVLGFFIFYFFLTMAAFLRGLGVPHTFLIRIYVGTVPSPAAYSRLGAGAKGGSEMSKVKRRFVLTSSAENVLCDWGEPWYFTRSDEHVSKHCRPTVGLFKEEGQRGGLHHRQQKLVVILRLQLPSLSGRHQRVSQWDPVRGGTHLSITTSPQSTHQLGPPSEADSLVSSVCGTQILKNTASNRFRPD